MKRFLAGWLVGLLICAGCGSGPVIREESFPLGKITRADLSESWLSAYDQPPIEPPFLEMIRQAKEGVEVLVFLGTWCSDSKRDVPRFLRIADGVGMGPDCYTLYSLDLKKTSPGGLEQKYMITLVPTFVFLRDGKEIGRIVELPRSTLEGDILSILASANS